MVTALTFVSARQRQLTVRRRVSDSLSGCSGGLRKVGYDDLGFEEGFCFFSSLPFMQVMELCYGLMVVVV